MHVPDFDEALVELDVFERVEEHVLNPAVLLDIYSS